jgi:hypothetical protein
LVHFGTLGGACEIMPLHCIGDTHSTRIAAKMVCNEKRDKHWRALVCKKGYQPVSRPFATKTAATRRAKQTGEKIENRPFFNVGDLH